MTAPEPLLRGVSSLAEKSILLVKTSLDNLRKVCVRLREASAKVRESEIMPESSSSMVAAPFAEVEAVVVVTLEVVAFKFALEEVVKGAAVADTTGVALTGV